MEIRASQILAAMRLRKPWTSLLAAASWSSIWYLLSAFAVISYTSNWAYVAFAAVGAWVGGFLSITVLNRLVPLRKP